MWCCSPPGSDGGRCRADHRGGRFASSLRHAEHGENAQTSSARSRLLSDEAGRDTTAASPGPRADYRARTAATSCKVAAAGSVSPARPRTCGRRTAYDLGFSFLPRNSAIKLTPATLTTCSGERISVRES